MLKGHWSKLGEANKPIFKADILDLCQHLISAADIVPDNIEFIAFLKKIGLIDHSEEQTKDGLGLELVDFAADVTREVKDCMMVHFVKKTTKIPFNYNKLAAILVRFKVIGEPNYEHQTIEYSYADMDPQPYETITEENAELRPDLVMLGLNMKAVREHQTATFTELGFTRRPKSIRSLVATITINMRLRKVKRGG